MITLPEAARRLGRDPETIRRWIRAGRLGARKIGTQYVIEESDLQIPDNGADVKRPPWMKRTATGEPMPEVVTVLRRQRAGR